MPVADELADGQQQLSDWQARCGYNPHALVSILPESRAWVDPLGRGVVCYLTKGNTWLAAGDPFAKDADLVAVARGFIEAANNAGKLISFVPATVRFAALASKLGLDAVPFGVAPYFDLQTWGPRGDKAKKVRAGVNQSRRAGVKVEAISGDLLSEAEVKRLCDSWLETRRTIQFGWLFALDPLRFRERKRFFIARNSNNEMIGLLAASPIPMRNGWYLEDILRHPYAPTGTSDLLIVEAMSDLARSGSSIATLGTVTFAGLDLGRHLSRGNHLLLDNVMEGIADHMEAIYNFQGLRRFKTKFAPTWWEPEYALFPPGLTHPMRIGIAAARAIAPAGIFRAIWNGSW